MEYQKILKDCTVHGNVIKLPPGQLDRKLYMDVNKALTGIGGKWNRKHEGFLFPHDPTKLLSEIAGGVKRNLKKEFQFFGTPDKLADKMVAMLRLKPAQKKPPFAILEPGIGHASLVKALWREGCTNLMWYCELDERNRKIIESIEWNGNQTTDDLKFICPNFLDIPAEYNNFFDLVIANPPFNKNKDIDHIKKMYEVTKEGGVICTVSSNHWRTSNNKKETEFREWFEALEADGFAEIVDLEPGEFKESGTNIAANILLIAKIDD